MGEAATVTPPRVVKMRWGDCERIARELDGAREHLKSCAPSAARRSCEAATVRAAVIVYNMVIGSGGARGIVLEVDAPTEALRRVVGHIADARKWSRAMPRVPREKRVSISVRLGRAEDVITGYLQLRLF